MEGKKTKSLRGKLLHIFLLCWLLPVLMILVAMGFYIFTSLGFHTAEGLQEQLAVNLRMCADRVTSAVEASRIISYDTTIKNAYAAYRQQTAGVEGYSALYRATQGVLTRQYRTDTRFRFVVFYYAKSPRTMNAATFNESAGIQYGDVKDYWREDHGAVDALADTLGTAVGFLAREGRVYLVRNVMDGNYQTIGTIVMNLNLPYYFESIQNLPWVACATVELGGQTVALAGDGTPGPHQLGFSPGSSNLRWHGAGDSWLYVVQPGLEYSLSATVGVDYGPLTGQFAGYQYLLLGMAVLLVFILTFFFRFFQRQVSDPIETLMEGARHVEEGELGYHTEDEVTSREFEYLLESFNRMSDKLRYQFDHIAQEELALRDAQIKALQAHINPHFLNNTLEIINWEARLAGNAKVSKMIEALSTVLDAAIDRGKRPEVRLAEELTYVSAYLYIIGERFGQRLNIIQEIAPETLDHMVPRLILQPVIENAVEHGIPPGGKGSISLRAYLQEDLLILETENDGGLSPEDEAHIRALLDPTCDAGGEPSRNIGIRNVNQRLRILYGGESGLFVYRGEGDRVVARMVVASGVESAKNDGFGGPERATGQ